MVLCKICDNDQEALLLIPRVSVVLYCWQLIGHTCKEHLNNLIKTSALR